MKRCLISLVAGSFVIAALLVTSAEGRAAGVEYLDPPPPPGAPRSPSEVKLRKVRRSDYDTYDEYKVAQLGPEWAVMVYPRNSDIDPYPACKEWKVWINQYGVRVAGWDWSENNCPWRKLDDCDDY